MAKTIKMKEVQEVKDVEGKPSYEDLEKALMDISQKYSVLTNKYNEAVQFIQNNNAQIAFKHLDYCFEVLRLSDCFEATFVDHCTKTIVGMLTQQPEESKEDDKA